MDKKEEVVSIKIMICPDCGGHGFIRTEDNLYEEGNVLECRRCCGTGETIDESKN